jgi:hypothetical protein
MIHGKKKLFWIAPLAILAMAAFGWVTMLLWNWLMPALFALPRIGYWEAWGLVILCKILFGGFHGGRGGHRGGRRWRAHFIERWEQMTPEEREKFRHGMRGCGPFTPAEEPKP